MKDGQPTSVIVVPAAPSQSALWGANELQWHLKKMTGSEVPIVTDRQTVEAGKVRIMVGESRATRALGVSARDYQSQEYSLQAKDHAIILLGRDVNKDYPAAVGPGLRPYPKGRFGGAAQDWASLGVKDHGFNDERGTMEAFIYVASSTNELNTGWMIFRVGDDQNGHNVDTVNDPELNRRVLRYQTFVNGQASEIVIRKPYLALTPGWHHLMATWDAAANKAEVFFDGTSVGTAPYAKTSCGNAPWFSIRGDPNNIPNCLGPIDEVRLSKVVRPPVVPQKSYETDDDTLVLLHFDDPTDLERDDSDAARLDMAATLAWWNRSSPYSNYDQLIGFKPPDLTTDRNGSLYAVYDFLEKSCGVRWYAPTEEGMVCPQTNTLTVTVTPLRRKPAFISRLATFGPNGWGMISQRFGESNPPDRYQFNGRLKLGGKNWLLTHTMEGWPDRFWGKNPANPGAWEAERHDYFYVNPDGSRNPKQICFSSTGALAQVILDARRYFDTGQSTFWSVAHDDFYAVGPHDTSLFDCSCPDCKKGYALAGTNWPNTFNNGKGSEIYYAFLNKVQAAIDQSNPGKHIASFNYMDYMYYPKTVKVSTNLYTGFAQCWSSVLPYDRKEMLDCYEVWRKNMPGRNQICVWRYDGWWWEQVGQSTKAFPMWYPHALAEEIQMYARDGARGLFYCGINTYFDGWLSIKLLNDPDIDIDYELEYFFKHYYGGAAAPMREIYRTIENTYTNLANWPPRVAEGGPGGGGVADIQWYWLGRPAVMAKLGKLMDEARQKADTDLAKKRVAAYERDIWRNHMLDGYNKYVDAQPGKKHPYPFLPPAPLVAGRSMLPGDPAFVSRAFFRNGGPGVGVLETGFDDRQGTMEAWVQVGGFSSNGFWHGNGLLFEIESLKPATGHRVYLEPNFTRKVLIPTYETWTGGKTKVVKGAPIPAPDESKWYHVAASWGIGAPNGASMALYVNGEPSGRPAPYRRTLCKDRAFTAGWPSKTMSGFGAIDEIRLSNVVRKPALQKEPYATDPNTLLLLHFDGEPGQPATDASKVTATK